MTAKCNLIIDSCCELPATVWEKPGVTMLNFTYHDGAANYVDDLFTSRTCHDFYEAMRNKAEPMTSQPSQMAFDKAFNDAADSGVPTVYLAFSSGISGCYEGAMTALERLKEARGADVPVYVVDLRVGSTPEGLLVAEALRQRERGMTAEEMVKWAGEARYFVHTIFMVDDLDALRRGGRIPSAAAVLGTALDVKPLLSFDLEGKLSLVGVARGRKRGIKRMADEFARDHDTGAATTTVAIGNADVPHDAERLRGEVERRDESALFLMTNIGPTIGCHVGPGMLSCCFWGADRRKQMSVSDRIAKSVKRS